MKNEDYEILLIPTILAHRSGSTVYISWVGVKYIYRIQYYVVWILISSRLILE